MAYFGLILVNSTIPNSWKYRFWSPNGFFIFLRFWSKGKLIYLISLEWPLLWRPKYWKFLQRPWCSHHVHGSLERPTWPQLYLQNVNLKNEACECYLLRKKYFQLLCFSGVLDMYRVEKRILPVEFFLNIYSILQDINPKIGTDNSQVLSYDYFKG